MASTARVVCWQNRDEWLLVYRALYSFDYPEKQRKGVDRVAAWRSRSAGKLPLAVECTTNLISAQLAVGNCDCDIQGRLTLSMAIVRFVNGMVDQVQKGKFARSVQSIADEIGLPDWLVDLRHEATHASLPSMETLQCGLRVSLSWLQGEYWEAQMNLHEGNTEKLSQLLFEYRHVALSHVTSRKKVEKLKCKERMKELSDDILNVVSMSNLWSLLPGILSREEMLVPSHDQLNTLGIKLRGSSDCSVPDVPAGISNMWKTLLEALDKASSEFTTSLVIHFLQNLSDLGDDQAEDISTSYAAWIKLLLELPSSKKPPLVLNKDIPWIGVLQAALENPTIHSMSFISLILQNIPAISVSLKEKIEHLVSIILNSKCNNTDYMEESQFFDLEEIMTNRISTSSLPQTSGEQESSSSSNLGWQVSRGTTQWHLIPFGEVLGTSDVSPTSLELSKHLGNSLQGNTINETQSNQDILLTSDEAIVPDSDDGGDVTCSIDQVIDQDEEPMLIAEKDHQPNNGNEGQNDINFISNQIYLF